MSQPTSSRPSIFSEVGQISAFCRIRAKKIGSVMHQPMSQTTSSRPSIFLSVDPNNGFACLICTWMGAAVFLGTDFTSDSEVGQISAFCTRAKKIGSVMHQPMSQTTSPRPSIFLSVDPNNGFACLTCTWMGAAVSSGTHLASEVGQNSASGTTAKKN